MDDNFISLNDLEYEISSIANRIGVDFVQSDNCPLITFGYVMYKDKCGGTVDEVPFVKIVDNQYYFANTKRGQIVDKHYSRDPNDVIYWLFDMVTYQESYALVKKYRQDIKTKGFNQRRFLYRNKYDLLNRINSEYGDRYKRDIRNILPKNPFCDGYPETLEYIDAYLEGHPDPMPDLHQEKKEPFPLMFSADNMKLRIRNDLGTVEICQTSDDDCWYDLALIKNLINQEKDINRPVDKTDLILFFNKSFEQVSELFRPENYQRTKRTLSLSNGCPSYGK